jgi:glycosyltransferase-like protein
MTSRLRIAILAHSTNPRGGVVHALELGDALCRLGHEATVHAPDASGRGFFRPTRCATVNVAASPVGRDVTAMVETRIADYIRHFEAAGHRDFDVWHTQDGISGNALATMKKRGLIGGFARTVHHVDSFDEPRLAALQARAIASADRLFAVSRLWRDWLAREFGQVPHLVGNGVDTAQFSPVADATDADLRALLNVPAGAQVFLAIGGVEKRKNTVRILEAFRLVHARHRSARLVIAGGASLLDHDAYQAEFAAAFLASGLPDGAVIRTGPLPQALMPALYRAANALVFPSVKEGFGLVVLEAMACGVPVVTSRIAPFTEYLGGGDVSWCDPHDAGSIAAAMTTALEPAVRAALVARGIAVAARHDWRNIAHAHLAVYEALADFPPPLAGEGQGGGHRPRPLLRPQRVRMPPPQPSPASGGGGSAVVIDACLSPSSGGEAVHA